MIENKDRRGKLDDEQKKLIKDAFREAGKEWLDQQFAAFGRWSLYGLAAAGFVALGLFMLNMNGWHR